ncbi:hypothetical protein [Sphingobium sp. YR768]|uniref:hypothetical protein n=1 Tax=Sphingobium sp. YR768 TaxID=1884365 RepID=UPI0008B5345E|nr:hypothetical protein [Sphingobium sp. YR768]SES07901.1 hypothetical protein SAMN05518866_1375 [Sphingobium sp. YR768]
MTALDRLNAIAATRPLTEQEAARLACLVRYYSRTPEQRARDNEIKRLNHAKRRAEINARKRDRYADDWLYAEKRRFQNRVDYRRRTRAA